MLHIPVDNVTKIGCKSLGVVLFWMHELSLDWKTLFPLSWLMQLGFFGFISTIWQRDVARASPFIKPWLVSGYRIVHDSLMRHSVIPSFICKAALLNVCWFWFASLKPPWHEVIQDEHIDQQLVWIQDDFSSCGWCCAVLSKLDL